MLARYPISVRVAASDLGRARAWYAERLGLTPELEEFDGLWYHFAGDTWLFLYQTPAAGTARNTVAGWTVDDLEAVVAELRARGVVFEEYDLGMIKTVDGIAELGGAKAAWFTDSEGNIFELTQPA